MGLDTSDALVLAQFLHHELMAMGAIEQYHNLLQELVLVPAGANQFWISLVEGIENFHSLPAVNMGEGVELN
jgi:hypothetical protein